MTPATAQIFDPAARYPSLMEQMKVADHRKTVKVSPTVPLVIYHADCNDGLTAAWVVKQAFAAGVDLYPAKYQQPPPDVTGREVVIVDFSYKRSVLLEMAQKAESILILDHHKSAEEDLRGIGEVASNIIAQFDMERSGAGLAWDYFYNTHLNGCTDTEDGSLDCVCDALPRPWFVNYVEHNDLWRHSNPKYDGVMPDCKAILEYIRSYPSSSHFEMYDHWLHRHRTYARQKRPLDPPAEVVKAGRDLLRAKQILVEQALTFATPVNYPGIGTLLVCNVPFFLASEVGHALSERNATMYGIPLGVTYYRAKDDRWSLSFRSVGDYDVSALAIVHGGGGHKNSAGASVDDLPWAVPWFQVDVEDGHTSLKRI